MRKFLAIALATLLTLSLAACGGNDAADSSAPVADDSTVSVPDTPSASTSTTSDGKTSATSSSSSSSRTTSTTTATKAPTLPTNGDWEKPVTINTAVLYNKKNGAYDKEAEAMRQSILNTRDTLKASGNGKTYYVSYRGNDQNDGLTPNTPFLTAGKLTSIALTPGSVVLFERGGVYRDVSISVMNGVSYGAYGKGVKPQLLGSDKSYADEKLWEKTSTANVWRAKVPDPNNKITSGDRIEDIGNIVFDHGKICASDGKKLSLGKLAKDYDFYHDAKANYVYLYLSKGNPGKLHTAIEVSPNEPIFRSNSTSNNTFENLCLKYTGGHGIGLTGNTNTTVRGCEIGYIGGSMLDKITRYGNGIEFFGVVDGALVENNWIYQCFDAGYTNQGEVGYQKNITVKNNLMEYSPYNIEIWDGDEEGKTGFENCIYENNILRFAGYGFGSCNRIGSSLSAVGNISSYDYTVFSKNFVIRNNILDGSLHYVLLSCYPNVNGLGPVIKGNTWVQMAYKASENTAGIQEAVTKHQATPCVGQIANNGTAKTYKVSSLAEMKEAVALFDSAPAKIVYLG